MDHEALFDRWFDGDWTVLPELNQALSDPVVQKAWVRRCAFEADLGRALVGTAVQKPLVRKSTIRRRLILLAAAMLFLTFGAGLVAWIYMAESDDGALISGGLLIDGQPSTTVKLGTRLQASDQGASLHLAQKKWNVAMEPSAEVILPISRGTEDRVELLNGKVMCRGSGKRGRTFAVATSVGKVIATGTHFGVEMGRDSSMHVMVSEGSVRVHTDCDREGVVLKAGANRTFNRAKITRRGTVMAITDAFVEVQEGRDRIRRWIITNETQVVVDGHPATLPELPIGAQVEGSAGAEDAPVLRLHASGPVLNVQLIAFDGTSIRVRMGANKDSPKIKSKEKSKALENPSEMDPERDLVFDLADPAVWPQVNPPQAGQKLILHLSADQHRVLQVSRRP